MKRKDFLKLGSAGLAGAAFTPLSVQPRTDDKVTPGPPHQSDHKLKKGFMLGTFPSGNDLSLLQKFERIQNAGFDGVEPESGLDRSEVLRAKEETGLEIPSVVVSTHWSQPLSSPDPSVREAGLNGLETALHDADTFGAQCVLLVPGVVNKDVSYDTVYRRSQEEIRKMIPLAEELGVTIAIENVWNHFLLSPMEAARYVDEFESPSIGWYFDIGNIINYGWPEHWIRILGKRISMIHIKEFSRQKRDDEGLWRGFNVNYREGDNNWPEIMKALRETGYNGYGIAEPPYRPEGVSTDEWLRDYIAGRMDEIFAL